MPVAVASLWQCALFWPIIGLSVGRLRVARPIVWLGIRRLARCRTIVGPRRFRPLIARRHADRRIVCRPITAVRRNTGWISWRTIRRTRCSCHLARTAIWGLWLVRRRLLDERVLDVYGTQRLDFVVRQRLARVRRQC